MQPTDLKFPGDNNGTLRRDVAAAIGRLQIAEQGPSTVPGDLAAFLSDAAAKTPGYAGPSLPATSAVVVNGGNVTVKNSAGTVTKTGVASVAASAITGVALAATEAIVTNAATVAVQNSAGTAVPGTSTATVAAGVVSNVKLPATVAPVVSGLHAVAATGTGTKVTFTVAGGVITAIALSA